MDLGLSGRACAVTGASRGIGRETARQLAAEGAAVVLVPAPQTRSPRRSSECEAAGGEAASLALDVTDPDAGERILAAAEENFGRLDVLVNNAGTATLAHARGRPRRGLAGGLGPQRDGADARDASGDPADGRARLGTRRQRRLDRGQASVGLDARVLGREVGRALASRASSPTATPREGVLVNADLPGPGRVGDVDGGGRPARPVEGARRPRLPRGGARGRRLEAPDRPPRDRRGDRRARSSSSAPSGRATSPAPPGRSTAARSR